MSTEATGDSEPIAAGAIGAAAGPEPAELTATAVDVPAADELAGDGTADRPAAGATTVLSVDEAPRQAPVSDDPPAESALVARLARRVGARGRRARRRAGGAGEDFAHDELAEPVTGSGGEAEAEPAGSAGDREVGPPELEGDGEAEPVGESEDIEAAEDVEANAAGEPGPDGGLDDDQPDEAEEPREAEEPGEAEEPSEAEERGEGYEDYEEYAEYAEFTEYEVYAPDAEAEAEADSGARPQRVRRWPRVLLGLGFVLLAAAIVGGAVAIVGSLTHGFKKPVKITYKSSPVFSLKTGECFDPRGQQAYTLIACDSPHQAEVFATFALTGASWPGNAVVQAKASDGCASRLTGYVNPQLAISLSSTYVYPDTIAWQAGTRTVICEVRATSGELTGSVRGSTASSG